MSFYGQGSLSGVGAFRPPQTSNRPMLAPLTHSTQQSLLSNPNNPLSWVAAPSSSPTHTQQASSSPRVSPLHHQHHQHHQQQQQPHHAIRDHRENRELDRELDRELRFRANIIVDQQRRIQSLEEQLKNAMEKMDQMANQLMDYETERRMFSRSMNLFNNPSVLPLPNNIQQELHYNDSVNNNNNSNINSNNPLNLWKEGISPSRSIPAADQNTPKKPVQQSRYWTPEEHKKFLDALERYGAKDVKAIAQFVGTRNATQVRTHAQKYFLKLQREKTSKNKTQGLSPPSLGNFQVPNSQDGSDAKGVSPVALSSALSLLHDMDDDDESRSSEDEDDVQPESGFSYVSSSPTSHSSVSTSSSPHSNVSNSMPLGLSLTSFSLLLSTGSPDQYNNNNNNDDHHSVPFKKRKTSLPVSISSSPPSERAAPSANSSSSNSPVSKSSLLQISALVSPCDD